MKNNSLTACKILIVGGGIAGLSAAIALHRQGLSPDLIEKTPSWQPIGAGLAMPANAVAVMQYLNLYEALREKGQITDSIIYVTDQNELLCQESLANVHPRNIPFIAIHRADLHEILLTAAKGIHIQLGVTLQHLEQTPDKVQITFSNNQQREYDLVIAADGVHSTTRQNVFPHIKPRYLGVYCWRYVTKRLADLPNSPIFYFGDNNVFLTYPIDAKRMYCYAQITAMEKQLDPVENRLERVKKIFAHYKGSVQQALSQIHDPHELIPGALETVEQDEWYRGRVLLVGDAAHACGPILQQGGAQALEDAMVLAETMKNATTLEEALQAFKARRQQRVQWVATQSNQRVQHASMTQAAIRNESFRRNGPTNIAGWRELFKTDP